MSCDIMLPRTCWTSKSVSVIKLTFKLSPSSLGLSVMFIRWHFVQTRISCTFSFFLSFLVWPLLFNQCSCRGSLLHPIALNDPHSVELLWTRAQSVAETSICTKHNVHNRQISVPPTGVEPAITASERPQTHAVDRTATGIGQLYFNCATSEVE